MGHEYNKYVLLLPGFCEFFGDLKMNKSGQIYFLIKFTSN